MFSRVAAVIPTHNRKEELLQCLASIEQQTRQPDLVIVVDNASTDGTSELLRKEFPHIRILRLESNLGSAGGFHYGMKAALAEDFDWIWLLDNDNLLTPHALENLLLNCNELQLEFAGCLVLSTEDPNKTAYEYRLPNGGWSEDPSEIRRVYPEGIIQGFLTPFGGCLISRTAIRKVGLPNVELFVWGDESDYFYRSVRTGIRLGTVLGAVALHPKDRQSRKTIYLLGRRMVLPYADEPQRFHIVVRNQIYIYWRYLSKLKALAKTIAYLIFFPKRFPLLLQAYRAALRLLMCSGKERRYL